MSRRVSHWAKRLVVATAFTTYMMPGCNALLNNPNFQSLLDSPLADGDFSFEFEFEAPDGGFDDGLDDGSHHGSDDEPGDDSDAG